MASGDHLFTLTAQQAIIGSADLTAAMTRVGDHAAVAMPTTSLPTATFGIVIPAHWDLGNWIATATVAMASATTGNVQLRYRVGLVTALTSDPTWNSTSTGDVGVPGTAGDTFTVTADPMFNGSDKAPGDYCLFLVTRRTDIEDPQAAGDMHLLSVDVREK